MEKKTYRIINIDNEIAYIDIQWRKTRGSFKTKDELLSFLHKKFSFGYDEYRKGIDILYKKNWVLVNCCHNWNDKFYTFKSIYEDGKYMGYKVITNYYDYMIIDPYDRIMNIQDLAEESYRFDKKLPEKPYKRSTWKPSNRYSLWEKRVGEKGSNYYRNIRVNNERRQSCDPMHMPYVRPKRRKHHLDPWNLEKCHVTQGTWKTVKIRKQWMENRNVCRTKKKNYRNHKLW